VSRFKDNLSYGIAAEKEFAAVLELKKYTPIRIKKSDNDDSLGGPVYTIKNKEYKSADIILCQGQLLRFIEVKHTGMCFYNNYRWELWLKYKQYLEYCEFASCSNIKLMIGWVVDGGFNMQANSPSPSGKFYQDLSILEADENKRIWHPEPDDLNKDGKPKDALIYWDVKLLDDLYDFGHDRNKLKTRLRRDDS
jgi:hypothetical protein